MDPVERARTHMLGFNDDTTFEYFTAALDAFEAAVRKSERLAVVRELRDHLMTRSLDLDIVFHVILRGTL